MKTFLRISKDSKNTWFPRKMFLIISGLFLLLPLAAQQRSISGVVKDNAGEPLIGVSIMVKGTTNGSISDLDGNYSLSSVSSGSTLVFSYMGYETKEVAVLNQSVINVTLEEDNKILDEVVVVGYGTQKKSDLTGSVVSVKAEDMNAIPTSSIAEMLRGQAAGVVITQNSARPGGGSDITIRGKKSLTGGNSPLYIVDGVPVENIDDFNSQDIASLEILKDASSQSIYGARASNGVILITTKRGTENKTTVDLSAYVGTQHAKRNFDLYSPEEWITLRREVYRNADGTYQDDASIFGNMYQNLVDQRYTDWEDLMIEPAIQQKYDLSVRSGGKNTKMAASIGYFDQKGMVKPADYKRGSFRFNVDHKFNDKVSIGLNTSYTLSDSKKEDDNINKIITQSPLLYPYDADGNLVDLLENSKYNPAFNNANMENRTKADRWLLNAIVDWKIYKGLSYRMNASLNSRNSEQGIYLNSKHESGSKHGGEASIEIKDKKDYLLENIFNYNWKINDKNKLDLTFVQSVNSIKETSTQMKGYGFVTDDLGYDNIGAASKTDPVIREITPRQLVSFMGRANYNLMERYLFSASARIDGSSVFGKNNKWGIFPAASFAWRLSEEDFMTDQEWLSNLKLRLSYGSVGNQAIKPYGSQGLVDAYHMQFGDDDPLVGYLPGTQLYNPDLKWETTTSFNAGIDISILRERISGTIEYYHSTTRDLLMLRKVNQISGYDTQMVNMGKVLNQGVEFNFNFVPVATRDWRWDVSLTFSANRNKILELSEKDANGNFVDDIGNKWFIGHNIDAYYDYQFDGIWQLDDEIPAYGQSYNAQPGDVKVKNVVNDDVISDEDRVVMNRDPKWIGSLASTLTWKGIDFSFDFYTVQGALRKNDYLFDPLSGGDLHGNLNGMKVNYWTPENPSNTAPRPRDATINYFSSLSYQDASYIRLRNISLGYTFPAKMMEKIYVSKLRIYATATNLWTKTDFLSYSPEASAGGYPEPKTFVIGLNVSF